MEMRKRAFIEGAMILKRIGFDVRVLAAINLGAAKVPCITTRAKNGPTASDANALKAGLVLHQASLGRQSNIS